MDDDLKPVGKDEALEANLPDERKVRFPLGNDLPENEDEAVREQHDQHADDEVSVPASGLENSRPLHLSTRRLRAGTGC